MSESEPATVAICSSDVRCGPGGVGAFGTFYSAGSQALRSVYRWGKQLLGVVVGFVRWFAAAVVAGVLLRTV